jgi:hypothetical protein
MPKQTKKQLSEVMALILEGRDQTPAIKRLKLRLRDLGPNAKDEVHQFRQLQKACREDPELAAALADVKITDLPTRNTLRPDQDTGRFIQAFNHFLETHWEED